MERDRYLSPMEAQDFGLIDRVLVHPPQAGQDEPELVQKEPAAASPAAQPESPAAEQSTMGTNSPSSYKPEPWTQLVSVTLSTNLNLVRNSTLVASSPPPHWKQTCRKYALTLVCNGFMMSNSAGY